jgi:RNA polymerase sigma-70 factor, ECF subfamily
LQSTALVHEAYLKLVGNGHAGYVDRAHFLAVAARVMRQVLVDYARARATKKRSRENPGDGPEWATRIEIGPRPGEEPVQLLDLDRVLDTLACEDQALAQLIEMRYFSGMTSEETASVLGESVRIVRHDLRLAQAWLRRKLSS